MVRQNTNNILDIIKVYKIKIEAYKAQYTRLEAVTFGLEIIHSVGVHFAKHYNSLNLILGLAKTK